MSPRYGVLVQLGQILVQAFVDWCAGRELHPEPFTFTIPGECIDGLDPDVAGVSLTLKPIRRHGKKENRPQKKG